jgi:transposase InsO family protein
MVSGLQVDPRTPKSDCVPYTEAKHAHHPFPSIAAHTTTVGHLTHIDIWGKYAIHSINSNQYYIVFIDDYSHYVTVQFLKSKDQAAQLVHKYITHLNNREIATCAIRVDRGTEFINEPLKTWYVEKGIKIQMTAPYSPSQNGVAKE